MGSQIKASGPKSTQMLSHGWQFKQSDSGDDEWLPVASVPSVVHLDLLHNSKIPDPFVGLNELDVEWVGKKSWTYRSSIRCDALPSGSKRILVFEGLDTFATASLNNQTILECDNMLVSHSVDVTAILNPGEDNVLSIAFAPALLRGRELKDKHSEYNHIACNGEPGRLAVRKAQYHWGWDWGPVLMTCGPWRPIRLETYTAKIEDVWHYSKLSASLDTAQGTLFARVDGPARHVQFTLKLANHVILDTPVAVNKDSVATLEFTLKGPELWNPRGYGEQTLYEISAVPLDNFGAALDDPVSKNIGFRHVELVQDEDKDGRSFYFRVNNVDVFCGGSCWIPADNFLPRISRDRYKQWLQLMVQGGQIMTRVWGGGIYEDDIFYDLCDELGILVWQDFMFACGSYPTWPALLDSIRQEARCNVRRLRHHPSMVLYAGNNEDYQVREAHDVLYDALDKDPDSWLKVEPGVSKFHARYIYEHLLPQILDNETCGDVPYWPSSPFSSVHQLSSVTTLGDVHEWNVWHGRQEKYQMYESLGGRFNSEFGLEALPHVNTIEYFAPDAADRHPHSLVLDFHNKAEGQDRRIAGYLADNFRVVASFEAYVHCTQIAQADAMAYAYCGWRRQWGHGRKCGGALVWQLNDCWPCTSWAIVDYFLRKKPAYYTIARALEPLAICVRREHRDWSNTHARQAKAYNVPYQLWISSASTFTHGQIDVELRLVSIASGKDIREPVVKTNVIIEPNGTTEILQGHIDPDAEACVLAAKLIVNGMCVSRHVDWPQPFKYLSFADRGVQVRFSPDSDGRELLVTAQRPTKGLVFEERDDISLSDSALDVIPGDEQIVRVNGLAGAQVLPSWRYLGQAE